LVFKLKKKIQSFNLWAVFFVFLIKSNKMSYYHNFLNGIPLRTLSLLEYYDKEKEKRKDHQNNVDQTFEVTLLISLAMPVFVITTEEIRHKDNNNEQKYKLQIEPVRDSLIFKNIDNIKIGKSKEETFTKIEFTKANNNLIISEKKVLSVLKLIRNALSHGNIKFQKIGGSEEIKAILFGSKTATIKYTLSEKIQMEIKENPERINHEFNVEDIVSKVKNSGWDLLLIDIHDFKKLLENWCKYLSMNKSPMGIVRHLNDLTIEELKTGTND
jgi:hypothetical protein